jgi:acetyl esterase/lipase
VRAPQRFTYGDDASRWADLYRPDGEARGVVVVIHGGFWKAAYEADLGAPLAADLARQGWAAWNLEYRRVGDGGGVPATLDDIAAGVDALTQVPDLHLGTVVTLGHSAGGHLAAWAAGRSRTRRWADVRVPVTGVVSQAGVLDLGAAAREHLGSDAVAALLGRPWAAVGRDERQEVDPLHQAPLDVPVWCVHGRSDDTVPLTQSEAYVAAARRAGGQAELVAVEGDHFAVIDTTSEAWARTVGVLDRL